MRLLEKLKKSFYSKGKLLKLIHLFEKDVGQINQAKKKKKIKYQHCTVLTVHFSFIIPTLLT